MQQRILLLKKLPDAIFSSRNTGGADIFSVFLQAKNFKQAKDYKTEVRHVAVKGTSGE